MRPHFGCENYPLVPVMVSTFSTMVMHLFRTQKSLQHYLNQAAKAGLKPLEVLLSPHTMDTTSHGGVNTVLGSCHQHRDKGHKMTETRGRGQRMQKAWPGEDIRWAS